MILAEDGIFQLHTENTSYVFMVTDTGHLEHLYYGEKIGILTADDISAMIRKVPCQMGNMITLDPAHPTVMLEDVMLEMSSRGKGDLREPFIGLIHPDGSRTSDFRFRDARIFKEKAEYETLPGSYGMPVNEHLCIILEEEGIFPADSMLQAAGAADSGPDEMSGNGLVLELHYYVYPDCDVISRSSRLINHTDETVTITRLMSLLLDLPQAGYEMTTFTGSWAREMQRTDTPVNAGTHSISSVCGLSSNRANPFFMLREAGVSEETGRVFGFHLIYSGNHYESVGVNAFGKTRVVTGMNPDGFEWRLEPDEMFEAPEAAVSFSAAGERLLSRNLHRFIREHIVRGYWKGKERPVLLNSWEAAYFRFDEAGLLKLAREAKKVGIELFVLDDGWFGKRSDDTSSLGDWYANREKLPHGLDTLAKKIAAEGLAFGIWVEPEMVSADSDLYRAHPDWTMEIKGRAHSEGRNQRILDLANPEVVTYLTETLCTLFSSAEISYVKWDCNRLFSDVYSPDLSRTQQAETAHRYVLGLYRLLKNVTQAFPQILFEGCASGGGRFDPGMLCYFPQIWGSDNTDPVCRAKIQEGYSYGYPLSCVSAHVSESPNHQTLRQTSWETRFGAASFGILGYECNLCSLKKEEKEKIREQITLYKKWRSVLQRGDFYRISAGNIHRWITVSPDRKKAVGLLLQEMVQPHCRDHDFKAAGLKEEARYHFYNMPVPPDLSRFGTLANMVSPVRIAQDGILQRAAARIITLPGETEDVNASGRVLMHCGVKLKGAFTGTGFGPDVRVFQDFDVRMYFIEETGSAAD